MQRSLKQRFAERFAPRRSAKHSAIQCAPMHSSATQFPAIHSAAYKQRAKLYLTFALVFALWPTVARAHDPRSAAVEVEVVGSAATVDLVVSQAGLHAAIEAEMGRQVDAQSDGYRTLVANYLRRTLRLSADGLPLKVGDIGLRLGNHQSDARFVVELPVDTETLTVAVDVLDGVDGHLSVVRVRQRCGSTRAVLSDALGQTVAVAVTDPDVSCEGVPASAFVGINLTSKMGALGLGALAIVFVLSLLIAVRNRSGARRNSPTVNI